MYQLELNNYGLHCISFEQIFLESYKSIVNDLFMYDKFHDHNVRSQDTRRIYYYHMIKHICDTVIDIKTLNKVVIYYSDKDIRCDFKQVMNRRTRNIKRDTRKDFVLFMNSFFKHIKSIIPVRVFVSPVKFSTFVQYYNTNKGKYIEMINQMRIIKTNYRFNFERFKKFTDKHKLTYLNEQYINQVKVKSIMYK